MLCLNGFIPVVCVARPPVKLGVAVGVKLLLGAGVVPKLNPALALLPTPIELSEGMGGILLVDCANGLPPVVCGIIDTGRLPTVAALWRNGLPPVELGITDARNGLEPVVLDPNCDANGLPVLTDRTPGLNPDAVEGMTIDGDVE